MRHINRYENEAEYESVKSQLPLPWVTASEEEEIVHYSSDDATSQPLTFVALEDSTITLEQYGPIGNRKTFIYKINNGQWDYWGDLYESYQSLPGINLAKGDMMLVKSDSDLPMGGYDYDDWGEEVHRHFVMTGKISASGNVMSLLNYSNELTEYGLNTLFDGCTSLTTAPELPATTLANNCYWNMFAGCTSLTKAPALPATTLAGYCYTGMFWGCTSLTKAPELPATTLANNCYSRMLVGCTSLTKAPELPATTLADSCYYDMFYGCTSLTTAPELPATTLANYCYDHMFCGCSALTKTPALPATTLAIECYSRMFGDCTSLTKAPELPATTLVRHCYWYMFEGCTSLTTPPALPATTLANNCYQSMFRDCISLSKAPELPATNLATYCYYGMFQGCSNLNYIKVGFTDYSAGGALSGWVDGVASTGTFVKPANSAFNTRGTNGIPNEWNIETVEPNTNGHEYVDLGLPSGTLWATCNVGANSATEYGKYFAWGDTEGYYDNEEHGFSWKNYKWCNGTKTTLTKYNNNSTYGVVDNKLTLDSEDDAAHVNMGGDWRMPTEEDLNELRKNTDNEWVTNYQGTGINGELFTSKKDTSKSIFIPASGGRWGSSVLYQSSDADLWSSTLYRGVTDSAWVLGFGSDYYGVYDYTRYNGFCVRGVL